MGFMATTTHAKKKKKNPRVLWDPDVFIFVFVYGERGGKKIRNCGGKLNYMRN